TRGIAACLYQLLDSPDPTLQRCVITVDGKRERDMPIGKRKARAWNFLSRVVLELRPARVIAGMASQFRSPQERGGIRKLLMHRAAMIVRTEGVVVKPKPRFQIAGVQLEQAKIQFRWPNNPPLRS